MSKYYCIYGLILGSINCWFYVVAHQHMTPHSTENSLNDKRTVTLRDFAPAAHRLELPGASVAK